MRSENVTGPVAFLFLQNHCDTAGMSVEELEVLLKRVHRAVCMLPEDLFDELRDYPKGNSSMAESAIDEVRCDLRVLEQQEQQILPLHDGS